MSVYSSTYDFYDYIQTHGLDNILKAKIHIGRNKLSVTEYKDLIPYFAHSVVVATFNPLNKSSYIHLSSESSVDVEEKEILLSFFDEIVRFYNRCRRKNKSISVSGIMESLKYTNSIHKHTIFQIIHRVMLNGKKASISGIHLPAYEYFRKKLVKEMIKYNIDPVPYGYKRFIEDSFSIISKFGSSVVKNECVGTIFDMCKHCTIYSGEEHEYDVCKNQKCYKFYQTYEQLSNLDSLSELL